MRKILYILLLIVFVLCIDKINAYTEYKIGDVVTYNDIDFYVIKDSSSSEDSVTMLKAEPLTVYEVNTYGTGHINRYRYDSAETAYDYNGYGGMAYYTNLNCTDYGYKIECTTDYASSEIKYVVDAWAKDKLDSKDLVVDSTGYSARLLSHDDLILNLGYINSTDTGKTTPSSDGITPSWVYSNMYHYWTMSPYSDSSERVWYVDEGGGLYYVGVSVESGVVRPVITLSKTAFRDENESIIDNDINKQNTVDKVDRNNDNKDDKTNEIKTTVKVDNTYMSQSIIIIVIGIVIASISVFVLYKLSNKRVN